MPTDQKHEMIAALCGHIAALLDKALSRMPQSWWAAADAARRDVAAARELLRWQQEAPATQILSPGQCPNCYGEGGWRESDGEPSVCDNCGGSGKTPLSDAPDGP